MTRSRLSTGIVAGTLLAFSPVLSAQFSASQIIEGSSALEAPTAAFASNVTSAATVSLCGHGMIGVLLADSPGSPVVQSVIDDSPAMAAGFKAKDRILSINGKDIADLAALRAQLGTFEIGQSIEIGIERDGWRKQVKLTLADSEQLDLPEEEIEDVEEIEVADGWIELEDECESAPECEVECVIECEEGDLTDCVIECDVQCEGEDSVASNLNKSQHELLAALGYVGDEHEKAPKKAKSIVRFGDPQKNVEIDLSTLKGLEGLEHLGQLEGLHKLEGLEGAHQIFVQKNPGQKASEGQVFVFDDTGRARFDVKNHFDGGEVSKALKNKAFFIESDDDSVTTCDHCKSVIKSGGASAKAPKTMTWTSKGDAKSPKVSKQVWFTDENGKTWSVDTSKGGEWVGVDGQGAHAWIGKDVRIEKDTDCTGCEGDPNCCGAEGNEKVEIIKIRTNAPGANDFHFAPDGKSKGTTNEWLPAKVKNKTVEVRGLPHADHDAPHASHGSGNAPQAQAELDALRAELKALRAEIHELRSALKSRGR